MKKNIAWLLSSVAIAFCGACTAQPENISLTGVVYNYSQEGYVSVKINGKRVGSSAKKVEIGEVSGGGGACCFNLPAGAKEIEIELEPSVSNGYKTIAKIEKWWPDLAHYGVVHILPGRKVVMQVIPSAPRPRKDLLEARQKELGLEQKVLFDFWSSGPVERIDGNQ